MLNAKSRIQLALGMTMLAGTVVLAGCAQAPYSRSTTSEQTTVTTPAPVATTTTTTTEQKSQQRP
jgi:uncharacterized lipoprotein YajG